MLVISIVLEAAVEIVAVLAARKGKPYIYGLAFTFGAYVLYDLARLLQWDVQGGLLSGLFLLATVTALIAVWGLERKPCRLAPVYGAFSNAYGNNGFPASERGNSGETFTESTGELCYPARCLGTRSARRFAPAATPMAARVYSRRQLLANAAIAASRVGS
jgi:hypothetical protein